MKRIICFVVIALVASVANFFGVSSFMSVNTATIAAGSLIVAEILYFVSRFYMAVKFYSKDPKERLLLIGQVIESTGKRNACALGLVAFILFLIVNGINYFIHLNKELEEALKHPTIGVMCLMAFIYGTCHLFLSLTNYVGYIFKETKVRCFYAMKGALLPWAIAAAGKWYILPISNEWIIYLFWSGVFIFLAAFSIWYIFVRK